MCLPKWPVMFAGYTAQKPTPAIACIEAASVRLPQLFKPADREHKPYTSTLSPRFFAPIPNFHTVTPAAAMGISDASKCTTTYQNTSDPSLLTRKSASGRDKPHP